MVESVNVEGWWETKEFTISNIDTTTHRDIELFIRYHASLAGDSLRVAIDTTTPDSLTIRECVTLRLDPSPNMRNRTRLTAQSYRRDVVWSKVGDYHIDITPHSHTLGVEAIGINIVKSE